MFRKLEKYGYNKTNNTFSVSIYQRFHDGTTNNPTYKCDQRTIDYSSKTHRQRTCISNAQKESQRRRIGKL